MNLLVGTVILAWLLYGCFFIWIDIRELAREQEREDLLDQLWSDE